MSNIAKTYQSIKFDPTNFNKTFESNDKLLNNYQNNSNENNKYSNENNSNMLTEKKYNPKKETIQNIIFNIRELFFQILDLIENNKNPLPFIFSTNFKYLFLYLIYL